MSAIHHNRSSLISSGKRRRPNLFGVNMSGAEFAPGLLHLPLASDFSYLASKGVTFVRFPIAWENIQTTLGGSLATTFLANVKSAIAAAHAHGIGVMVDLHNYGAYVNSANWAAGYPAYYTGGNGGNAGAGVSILGDGTLTAGYFADVWSKLATALVGTPGLAGYGLMNEPSINIIGKNLLKTPNYISGVSPSYWYGNYGPITELATGTNPLGAGYGPAWSFASYGSGDQTSHSVALLNVPYTFSIYAKLPSGASPSTMALSLRITDTTAHTSTDQTVTTSWQRFSFTYTPSAAPYGTVSFFQASAPSGGQTVCLANAQLELGSSATAYEPSAYTPSAQAAINAIRAVDSVMPIYINGMMYSTAVAWVTSNYEMCLMTGGNLIFEAHQYFDTNNGGVYNAMYSSYGIADSNEGVNELAPFLGWLTATGMKGHIGEFSIPPQMQSSAGSISGSVFTAGGTLGNYAFDVGQQLSGPGITAGPNSVIVSAGTGTGRAGTYNLAGSPGNVSNVAVQATITPSSPWWPIMQKFLQSLRNNGVPATVWFYGSNGSFTGFSYNQISGVGDNPALIQVLNAGKDSGFFLTPVQ